ncbi:ABC transporter permease [Bosea sp. LjRoot237]|uniref:ABC transporter permease n=1 Tax=Bosea sp. LjRoot237 TaxID=3342292 RepID=UPI003ECE3E6E
MIAFVLRRMISALPVIAIVAVLTFLMLRLTPGDPAAVIAGDSASSEQIAAVRERLGLDGTLVEQFVRWVGNAASGDFGQSYYFRKPVAELIAERVEPTLLLSCFTLFISVIVAVPLGVIAAWKRGSLLDRAIMGFSVFGFSVPVFVVGYALIYIFAIQLNWLPVQGYRPIASGVGENLQRLILPVLSLATVFVALIARMTRTNVVEILNEDYIRTARSKGQEEGQILFKHALANAANPIITVVGLGLATLIGGVVVTESVFTIPGLGRLTVDAVLGRDYPTIQAIILLFSLVYVGINLIIDVMYTIFDPRVSY